MIAQIIAFTFLPQLVYKEDIDILEYNEWWLGIVGDKKTI